MARSMNETLERIRISHLIEDATSNLLYSTHNYAIGVFGACDLQNAIDATRSVLVDIEDSLNATSDDMGTCSEHGTTMCRQDNNRR